MKHITTRLLIAAVAAGALAVPLAASAATPLHAAGHPAPVSASTAISNRPDSGNNGDWALDNFTRTVTITLVGEVAQSNCGGPTATGHCYLWDEKIDDFGHFTAQAGDLSPRAGTTLDRTLTGSFTGGTTSGQFFSSWKTAKATLVPATENDQSEDPTGKHTTSQWAEQFFGASAQFAGESLVNWLWTYTLNFGADNQCPNDAFRWQDGANNGDGAQAPDGDILTPNSADC